MLLSKALNGSSPEPVVKALRVFKYCLIAV